MERAVAVCLNAVRMNASDGSWNAEKCLEKHFSGRYDLHGYVPSDAEKRRYPVRLTWNFMLVFT